MGNGEAVSFSQPIRRSGERRKLPSGVRGGTQAKNDFSALTVSERLSLQRLLKINVVHRRPLAEKKRIWSVGISSDPFNPSIRHWAESL